LGLFIAKTVVDGHGGSIDAESSDAAGTTFRIRLPRHAQSRTLAMREDLA
jgi:signal transduction histidine kinase